MNDECDLSEKSAYFIKEWIMGGKTRTKTNMEIWENVIKQYKPDNFPVLFRSCPRVSNYPIQSYTDNIETARRFSGGKGYLCIIDTQRAFNSALQLNNEYGFFPLYDLIRKELSKEKPLFSKKFYDKYKGEAEYVVKAPMSFRYVTKWCNNY